MTVVAYVSGHGLGHAAREVEVLRRLPPGIELIVKTQSPEWFWRQEVARPFTLIRETFDIGVLQTTSVEADVAGTLAAWQEIDARNRTLLESEAAFLRDCEARVVVADVSPFGIEAAVAAGVPVVCVANFTWADIYDEYSEFDPAFGPIVQQLRNVYGRAILLDCDLSLPMPYFCERRFAGLIARPGAQRREELLALLGDGARGKRLALVYAGNWGLPVPWERLERLTGWHFVSLGADLGRASNLSYVPQEVMPHPDFVASVDLVVSKPGYGLVGECLAAGTPFLYCSRRRFAEYARLDAILSAWPGGLHLPDDAFFSADWASALDRVPPYGCLAALPAPGGEAAATILAGMHESSSRADAQLAP